MVITNLKETFRPHAGLCLPRYVRHDPDAADRILSLCRFAGQHRAVGAVENGVGDVRRLSPKNKLILNEKIFATIS